MVDHLLISEKYNHMKQIIAITGIILIIFGMFSCKNQDRDFPDFEYTSTYFPYQFPIRTLVLGDFYYDNTLDNEYKFLISATLGGVYENTETFTVNFAVDPTLTSNLYFNAAGTQPVIPLPASYYTLSDNGKIIIPGGKMSGSVTVQLTEAFFNDPLAIGNNYVIPLKISGATSDSVLQGRTTVANPDPRRAADWILMPKNYTLFGIKFVNEYSGKYLMKGKNVITRTVEDTLIETFTYRNKYVEKCEVVTVTTTGKDSVYYTNNIRITGTTPGAFKMRVGFDASGNGTIVKDTTSVFDVSGTARFVKNDDLPELRGHRGHQDSYRHGYTYLQG
jgi:hypothetical protein